MSGPATATAATAFAAIDGPLDDAVLATSSGVLNAVDQKVLADVLGAGAQEPLRSDCDEQLLISVPFKSLVKLHTLVIASPNECSPCCGTQPRVP